jgi:ATPases involved in chromosome partitioning
MNVVSVLSEKGGAGKTTIAVNLATAFHLSGTKTLIVDADPQATARDWGAASDADTPVVAGVDRGSIREDVPRLGQQFELVMIDGAPRLQETYVEAVTVSDLVLVPVRPSAADIWSAETIIEVCRAYNTPAAFVVSQQVVGTALADQIQDALESFDVPVLDARPSMRVAYTEALGAGQSVLQYAGRGKAAGEVHALHDEVSALLNQIKTDG